jgi:hypothetical protein
MVIDGYRDYFSVLASFVASEPVRNVAIKIPTTMISRQSSSKKFSLFVFKTFVRVISLVIGMPTEIKIRTIARKKNN